MTSTDSTGTPALDGPTLFAALVTVAFAILAGMAVGNLPQDGSLGGALDAVKNVVYMLTVPLFDLARRAFSRRATRRDAPAGAAAPHHPDLLRTAFVSALVIFAIIEVVGWLTGFAMGSTCLLLGFQVQNGTFGQCLATGVQVFAPVLVAPIMIALGAAAGWMWRGLVPSRLWLALLIFMIVVAGLFALDYVIMLQQTAPGTELVRETFSAMGPVIQVGLQVVILTTSLLAGYAARSLWHGLTRRFA